MWSTLRVVLDSLIKGLKALFVTLPDRRRGDNSTCVADFGSAAFAEFFTQSPSFLSRQTALQRGRSTSNCQTLFGSCSRCSTSRSRYSEPAAACFCSQKLSCTNCCERKRSNGKTEHFHAMVSAAMVAPASAIPKIVIAEAGNFPDIARFYLDEVIHRGLGLFRRLLELGVARGEFSPMDVDSTAYCIVAPIVLGMLWRHSFARHEKRPMDAGALCRAHLQVLSRGLVPVQKNARAASVRPRRRRNGGDR